MSDARITIENLKLEYKGIIASLQEGKATALKQSLEGNQRFFSGIKELLQKGSLEEKKEAFQLFTQAIALFLDQMQKNNGQEASFDKVLASLTPEQSALFEKAKEDLAKIKEDLKGAFSHNK